MPKIGKKFSVKLVESLKPKASPYRLWEGVGDSFGVQVSPASKRNPEGKKSFFMTYRFGDDPKIRYCALGDYDPSDKHSLHKAKDELKKVKGLLEKGIEPQTARKEEKLRNIRGHEEAKQKATLEQSIGSIQQLFEFYTEQMKIDGKPSWKETRRSLEAYVLSKGDKDLNSKLPPDMKAKDVTPQHIRKALFAIVERGAPILANRVRSYLSAAFNYGIGHDLDPKNLKHEVTFQLGINPVRDVPKPQRKESPGKRNLNWEEIKEFWHNVGISKTSSKNGREYRSRLPQSTQELILKIRKEHPSLGKEPIYERLKKQGISTSISAIGRLISSNLKQRKIRPAHDTEKPAIALKLMLVLGQRVSEVLSAGPHDFNLDTKIWEILDTKNGRTHVVPLNDISITLLEPLIKEAITKGKKYLFPKRGSGQGGREEEPMLESSLNHYATRFYSTYEQHQEQQAFQEKPKKFEKFTPRDLRRTWKTRTGEIGISKEIRDRIQNHALDDVSAKHYDYYEYLPEKREAMDKWDNHLKALLKL